MINYENYLHTKNEIPSIIILNMIISYSGQTNATFTENAMELIKMVYNFLCFEESEPPGEKFNERVRNVCFIF